MNIIKREMRRNRTLFFIWCLIIIWMFAMVCMVYPSIAASSKQMNEMMEMFPKEMLAAFNMDISDISSFFGWYKSEGLMFVTLLGSCFGAILGSTILLKEENDKSVEFLLSKPISRNKVVLSKLISGLIYIILFNIVTFITLYLMFYLTDDNFKANLFIVLSLGCLFLHLLFYFISFALSLLLKNTKSSMAICLGIVLLSYFMQIIGNMSDKLSFIKHISFFEFMSTRNIILNNQLDYRYLGISIVIIVGCIIFSFYKYNKKNFS